MKSHAAQTTESKTICSSQGRLEMKVFLKNFWLNIRSTKRFKEGLPFEEFRVFAVTSATIRQCSMQTSLEWKLSLISRKVWTRYKQIQDLRCMIISRLTLTEDEEVLLHIEAIEENLVQSKGFTNMKLGWWAQEERTIPQGVSLLIRHSHKRLVGNI